MIDFPVSKDIVLNSITDDWGPYQFDLAGKIPPGETIASVDVSSTLEGVASNIVEPDSVSIDGTSIKLRLQYPGANQAGKHLLLFDVTTQNGGKNRFTFSSVKVE